MYQGGYSSTEGQHVERRHELMEEEAEQANSKRREGWE
jgi:hypothetical protein